MKRSIFSGLWVLAVACGDGSDASTPSTSPQADDVPAAEGKETDAGSSAAPSPSEGLGEGDSGSARDDSPSGEGEGEGEGEGGPHAGDDDSDGKPAGPDTDAPAEDEPASEEDGLDEGDAAPADDPSPADDESAPDDEEPTPADDATDDEPAPADDPPMEPEAPEPPPPEPPPEPQGACTGASDQAVFAATRDFDPDAEAPACVLPRVLAGSGPGSDGFVAGVAECLAEDTGLTLECATCYAQNAECSFQGCGVLCLPDRNSRACRDCRCGRSNDVNCFAQLSACTGLSSDYCD